MRLPIVPAWFPLRALALQGVMALCVLLFCLAPLWYVTWKLEADIKGLETRIQVQETLQPLMEGLNARREETRRLVLLLSEQPWLSGMEFLNVTPSGALPAYSLGIWATFTQQANTPRH